MYLLLMGPLILLKLLVLALFFMRAAVTPALIEVEPVLSSMLPVIQEVVSTTPLESSSVYYGTVFIFSAIAASHVLWGPAASLLTMATAVVCEIVMSTPSEVSTPVVVTTSTLVESALESIPTLGPHRVVLVSEEMLGAGEVGGIAVVTSWFLYAVLGSYYSHGQSRALSIAKSRATYTESRSTSLVNSAFPPLVPRSALSLYLVALNSLEMSDTSSVRSSSNKRSLGLTEENSVAVLSSLGGYYGVWAMPSN